MENRTENRGRKLGSKVRKNILTVAQLKDGTLPDHMPISVSKGIMDTYNLLKQTYSSNETEQETDEIEETSEVVEETSEVVEETSEVVEETLENQPIEADSVAVDLQEKVEVEKPKVRAKIKK